MSVLTHDDLEIYGSDAHGSAHGDDSMEWDLVDEETALRVIGDPERFDDERGPDPEATRPRRRRRR